MYRELALGVLLRLTTACSGQRCTPPPMLGVGAILAACVQALPVTGDARRSDDNLAVAVEQELERLEAGGSLAALQDLLGHSSIVTTQRYGRLGEGHVRAEAERIQGRMVTGVVAPALNRRP